MGGLLAADTLIEFYNARVDTEAPLWPNIIACLAFDTPYLGLHPGVFRNQADQAISYARDVAGTIGFFSALGKKVGDSSTALGRTTPTAGSGPRLALAAPPPQAAPESKQKAASSGWGAWAPTVGGLLAAGAAAGAAYYQRETLATGIKRANEGFTGGLTWANDHMKYVGSLWDEKALQARVDALIRIRNAHGVRFQNFFTVLDSTTGLSGTRTFCVLPRRGANGAEAFVAAHNKLAQDEVAAHISMFDPKINDGYYALGLATARVSGG